VYTQGIESAGGYRWWFACVVVYSEYVGYGWVLAVFTRGGDQAAAAPEEGEQRELEADGYVWVALV
jgi:hypothetical protein